MRRHPPAPVEREARPWRAAPSRSTSQGTPGRRWSAWGLAALGALLLATVGRAEEARPLLVAGHVDVLSTWVGFRLRSVEYVLDGRPLAATPGEEQRWEVTPGVHQLILRVVYEGSSTLFGYVRGYRFTLSGRVTFEAQQGYEVHVRCTSLAREGLTVPWEQRPTFRLEGAPRRAVLSIEGAEVLREELEEAPVVEATVPPPEEEEAPEHQGPEAPPGEIPCEGGTVFFGFADTRLGAEAEAVLGRLAECLRQHPGLRLRVEGHGDARGSEDFNLHLGQGRAQTVVAALEALGVAWARLELASLGERQPACQPPSEACYARSRRVELLPRWPAPGAVPRR